MSRGYGSFIEYGTPQKKPHDQVLTRSINKKISRRSFIKWSSAIGATASMSGLIMQAHDKIAGA